MKPLRALALLAASALSLLAQNPAPKPPAIEPTREKAVFLPFAKMEEILAGQNEGVFIPSSEFLQKWRELNLPEQAKANGVTEGVAASAKYTGRITGDAATLDARLEFESLRAGWSKIALGAKNMALSEVKTPGVLHYTDAGYELLLPEKGLHPLTAQIVAPVSREAGRRTLALSLPRTAVASLELDVPERGLEFTISPAVVFTTTENPDGTTRLSAFVGAAERLEISWTKKAAEAGLTPLIFARTTTTTRIGTVVSTNIEVGCEVLRVPVAEFTLSVPGGQQVLDVSGQTLRDWKVTPDGENQRLVVTQATAEKGALGFSIRLESALPKLPATIAVPAVAVQGVRRQTGEIQVLADADWIVEAGAAESLVQQTPAAPPGGAVAVAAFRHTQAKWSANFRVSEAEPRIEAATETQLAVLPDEIRSTTRVAYNVKKAGVFSTRLLLPGDFTKAEATGEKVESSAILPFGNDRMIEVKFREKITGATNFTVTAEGPRAKPDSALPLPLIVPAKVERHDGLIGVGVHASLKATTTEPGALREEDVRAFAAWNQPAPLTLAFRQRGEEKTATLAFELRQPRVSVTVLALLDAAEAQLRTNWTLDYNVEYAGINAVEFELPTALGADVQIKGQDIKERTSTEVKDAQGQPTGAMRWRVVFQTKKLGAFQLDVSHQTPRLDAKPGQTALATLAELRPLNVAQETGQVAVLKDGNLEITKTDTQGLDLMDASELSPALRRSGVFLAYKYQAHPVALRLDISKNIYLPVPRIIISRAVLSTVVDAEQAQTFEAVYWVQNNAQQYLSIELPSVGEQPARLLSDVFVDGEPQQPARRPDRNELIVRLPSHGVSRFAVRFVFELPSPGGAQLGWRGQLALNPPRVLDAEILHTTWSLWLPRPLRYTGVEGPMREMGNGRDWRRLSQFFVWALPDFDPNQRDQTPSTPELPALKKPGFDTHLQRDGVRLNLSRLDQPEPVKINYRGRRYATTVEGLLWAVSLGLGLWLIGQTARVRFTYLITVGIGSLLVAGALGPRAGSPWECIALGAFCAAGVWFICGALRTVAGRFQRKKTPPPMPPTPPANEETQAAA